MNIGDEHVEIYLVDSSFSPNAQPGENEEARVDRLMHKGNIKELLLEVQYYVRYYSENDDAELDELVMAQILLKQALIKLGSI